MSKEEVKRVLLPSWFTVQEYDMTLHPNVDPETINFRFEGSQTLQCTIDVEEQTVLTLHSKEVSILSAHYKAEGFDHPAVSLNYNLQETTVEIGFGHTLPKGSGVLSMEFIATHNNQMAGFYRCNYTDATGKSKVMVSTQFEALDARRCFPCIDEPAAKSIFKATLVVDAHLTALSNMPEVSSTLLPGGRKKKVSFMPSPIMSTYLLCFCVGEFDFVAKTTQHGVPVRVYTPPGKANEALFSLDVAVQALDFYDDYFGVPFPLPKMDMIAITEFAMGAMENFGLITYREIEILTKPNASAKQKQRVALVITHELAHQWFGNLVTMAWWNGLWLNEGFASWMEYFAANHIFPSWSFWSTFVIDDQAGALGLDSLLTSHPVEVPIGRAEEVEEVFDGISYHKGACIVQLAHAYLGPQLFQEGLRLYFQRHQYKNTETHDLWQAWEQVSSKPVGKVIGTWTSQMGYPLVTVSKVSHQNNQLTFEITQEWFFK